jgi:hypothetical protein
MRTPESASCGDCGFHHDPLDCPFRKGRKEKLARMIAESQEELTDMEAYERERGEGKLTFEVSPMGGEQHRVYRS